MGSGAVAVLISAALVLSGIFFYWRSGVSSLNRSMDVLVREHLYDKYQVRRSFIEAATSDPSGVWWIVLDDTSQQAALAHSSPVLQPADEYDRSYYEIFFIRQLNPGIPLGSYQLYRGEALLGPGSSCEASPCNIAALVKRGDRNVFLSISTN